MIFSVQRYIEDYLHRRNIEDLDQYAVRIANLYGNARFGATEQDFLERMCRIRTVIFQNNRDLNRAEFEKQLLRRLDRKFMGNPHPKFAVEFPGGLRRERRSLRNQRRSIDRVLAEFQRAVESRAVDTFWRSRRKLELRRNPEQVAQGLLAVFAKGVVGDRGLVLRELFSGIGFADVAILFARTAHLVELKVVRDNLTGPEQLGAYMAMENRPEGWLLAFDVRKPETRSPLAEKVTVPAGIVKILNIDINPLRPSRRK